MAKFYYNGVLLPEIPKDVLAEYPYVVIVRTFSLSTTRFFAKKSPYYYNYSDYKVVSPEVGGQLCTLSDDGESWSSGTTLTGETSLINNPTAWELVWTTHDIPFDSITSTNIYFHSSNPIPENAEYWQIESGTLISFGDQARRIKGTTEKLSIEQMLEIFSGAGGGMEGLENGYDVMFYKENDEALAFYSIKQGEAINPPVYSCKAWQTEDGTNVTFPYTPTNDLIVYANNDTFANELYNHYGVDKAVYPYVMVQVIHKTNNSSYPYTYKIAFFDTITKSINQPRLVGVNSNISQSTHDYYISDLANVEEVVNAIKEKVTTINSSYSADIVDENSTTLFYNHYTNFDYNFNYSTLYRLDE